MIKRSLVACLALGLVLPSQGWAAAHQAACDELFTSHTSQYPVLRDPRELRGSERVYQLRSIKMLLRYREIDARATSKFTPDQKIKAQLTFRDGLFFDSENKPANYGFPQNFLIDLDFNLYAFTSSRNFRDGVKTIKHSSVTGGERTHFAGEAVFENGKLVYLSNKSGHYAPFETDLLAALLYLNSRGVDISETEIKRYQAHDAIKEPMTLAHDFIRRFIPGWQP